MKTIILFVSLILALVVCNGQNLVQEGKLWSNTSIGTMPGSTYESYFIKFMGDTTINGLAYKKIMKSKDELNANWSSAGYMREETTTRKVFVYNKAGNKDILLYDFSLDEGDSILTGDGHSYAKVTKVTNDAFGNSPVIRKQIYFFDTSGNTRWIEGVGSTWGILEGLNSFYTTGATASLVCYYDNDELIYHYPRFDNCFPKGTYEENTLPEFAPIGAEWHYNHRESFMSPATGYYVLKSSKDTIIDSKLCKVLTHTLVSSKDVASGKGRSIVYHDTNENKVYRYLYGSFHLLYDFTKQTGDTLIIKEPLSATTYDSIKLVVDSVGIVKFANNIQRKSLFVHSVGTQKYNFSGKIIEGIGNVNFFFFPVNSIGCDSGCPSPLRCYKDQNISEQFTYQTCDFVYTNIDNIKTIDVSVYPNPVSNDLFIEGNFNEKEYTLELYSIQGNLIKTECMAGGINLYRMEAGSLGSGSYILRVISQKGNYAERMIIKK